MEEKAQSAFFDLIESNAAEPAIVPASVIANCPTASGNDQEDVSTGFGCSVLVNLLPYDLINPFHNELLDSLPSKSVNLFAVNQLISSQ